MSENKHYEMQWDCKYCGTTKLLGKTHRFCPNCGAAQDPDTRYFPSDDEKVAVEDHVLVGKDKICSSCGTLNSANSEFCMQCGAPMTNAKEAGTLGEMLRADGGTFESSGSRDLSQERFDSEMERVGVKQPMKAQASKGPNWVLYGIIAVIAVVIIGILATVFWKRETSAYVVSHAWEREIRIEDYGPRSDNAWCDAMPAGAYSVTRREEQRSSRQVADGEECSTRRVDNGDGTFSERRECRTKYREEPIYDTKCYYTIDRWEYARSATATGDSLDDDPVWPDTNIRQTGTCRGCEREGTREDRYLVQLRESDKTYTCEVEQDAWQAMRIESTWTFQVGVISGQPDCSTLEAA